MFHTCFWPYNQVLEYQNSSLPGEITGQGLRTYDKGVNTNDLDGTHYEGTEEDFAGNGTPP